MSSSSFYCNPTTVKILSKTVQELYSLVNDIKNEVTCPLNFTKTQDSTELLVLLDTKNLIEGTEEKYVQNGIIKTRKTVNQPTKYNVFHTHPKESKPYPSIEDIFKLLKNFGIICNSFIATRWGLWIMSSTEKSDFYYNLNHQQKEKEKQKLYKFLDQSLAYFYKINKDNSSEIYIPDNETSKFINTRCEKISGNIHIKIKFYSWFDLMSNKDHFVVST